jgi:hypothetical protein
MISPFSLLSFARSSRWEAGNIDMAAIARLGKTRDDQMPDASVAVGPNGITAVVISRWPAKYALLFPGLRADAEPPTIYIIRNFGKLSG